MITIAIALVSCTTSNEDITFNVTDTNSTISVKVYSDKLNKEDIISLQQEILRIQKDEGSIIQLRKSIEKFARSNYHKKIYITISRSTNISNNCINEKSKHPWLSWQHFVTSWLICIVGIIIMTIIRICALT